MKEGLQQQKIPGKPSINQSNFFLLQKQLKPFDTAAQQGLGSYDKMIQLSIEVFNLEKYNLTNIVVIKNYFNVSMYPV